MKLNIDGLAVYFPYDYIYPEQYEYMTELKRSLDAQGHCLLEMPSGTGKTVCLLSLITAYLMAHPDRGKLIYCTRTVPEMEKVLEEMQRLIAFRERVMAEEGLESPPVLAVGLSSRKNLCIHPEVSQEYEGQLVDAKCRSMTASWVREQFGAARSWRSRQGGAGGMEVDGGVQLCDFFEEFEVSGKEALLPAGVYTLADLREFGRQHGWCPYFLARHMINLAQVVVYNYAYLLDPKIAAHVSHELKQENIVVFDEAHNIDNVCIESLSVHVDEHRLRNCARNLKRLDDKVKDMKERNKGRLEAEYRRLVTGLATEGIGSTDLLLANPVLPQDILQEAVPGNIRKAEHFISFMRRFLEYVKVRMDVMSVVSETPSHFVERAQEEAMVTAKAMRFCSERLVSLLTALEEPNVHEYQGLRVICDLATLAATYSDGFVLIIEPFDERLPTVHQPVLQLSCMDASLAVAPVFQRFRSVIITSGTLSPLDFYPKLLHFHPVISRSFRMTLTRKCICPMIISRGNDQTPLSSKFDLRNDPAVTRNFGSLLVELSATVPDGIICFFTSYKFMEDVVNEWWATRILDKVVENKLVFIETPNTAETALSLENYRKACDSGRGAVFLSIARGKVAEGIDFDGHYGRAVLMFGIPYVFTESRVLRARLEYLRTTLGIRENDFLSFDALRQASQCIGRVLRNKSDYGLMLLIDKRYTHWDKRGKLPRWILDYLPDTHLNLSVEVAMSIARDFLKEMAQPWELKEQIGHSLLSKEQIERYHLQMTEPSAAPESIRMGRASVMDLDLARAVIPMEKKGDEDSELMSQDMEEALRAELAAETMDVDS